jgi:putative nucleotidyltransferase with HDIG domain
MGIKMPERILVVDDEEAIRQIICSMLTVAGYQCQHAGSGTEALALLESGEQFELMLTNLMMPTMDGIDLLEHTNKKYPDMPVVMVTGVHDISVALAAIRNGAYDYLLKPFEREQLQAIVRLVLEKRRLKINTRAYHQNLEALVTARTEQLQKTMLDLERAYDITLEAFGDSLKLKDAETEHHSKRVTGFTIALTRAFGLSGDKVRAIARGAFLHDIGKIAIPRSILRKSGELDAGEIEVMRGHCDHGHETLRKIPFLAEAAEIAYAHHERWDGTGYPRGLKGDGIPLGARIVAVANTLDAIISNQPYRDAQPYSAAREEIVRWSGRQFDPEVVRVFLSISESIWHDLRKEIDQQIACSQNTSGKGA